MGKEVHYSFYALTTGKLVLIGGGDYESDYEAIWHAGNYVKPVDVIKRDWDQKVVWTVNSSGK